MTFKSQNTVLDSWTSNFSTVWQIFSDSISFELLIWVNWNVYIWIICFPYEAQTSTLMPWDLTKMPRYDLDNNGHLNARDFECLAVSNFNYYCWSLNIFTQLFKNGYLSRPIIPQNRKNSSFFRSFTPLNHKNNQFVQVKFTILEGRGQWNKARWGDMFRKINIKVFTNHI